MRNISRISDFRRIYQEGKKYDRGPIRLVVFFRSEDNVRTCFLGRSRLAVRRNRIKRKLKECFREHYFHKVGHCAVDILFMSDERLIQADSGDVVRWIGDLLQRAGVMKEEARAGLSE